MFKDLWVEGVIVEFNDGLPCKRAIIRNVRKHEITLVNISDGNAYKLPLAKIKKIYESDGLKLLAESRDFGELKFFDLTEKEQREVNRKYQYIKQLNINGITKITQKNVAHIILEVSDSYADKPPHWQSVRNWYQNYKNAGNKIRGLYPKHRFKGSRVPKIDLKVLDIIKMESKRYYKLSQPSMASIYRNVESKINAHNLDYPHDPIKVPTYLTVQKRILDNSYQNKKRARQGEDILQAELASSNSGIITTNVLERVEIDHTLLDIHLLDDERKTLLGRPNITVLIDHFSHMVLGFQISFEAPSFASVSMACLNAFLPKDKFLLSQETTAKWPAKGVPMNFVTDNGNEFWGNNFDAVANELGSIFQYCRIRKGNYKSRVERFFGIVNSMVLDDLPGVVRKKGKSGDRYDARQEAQVTFSEFKHYFITWLLEVFHNTPLEDSNMTPNELWVKSDGLLPVPEEDEMEMKTILMATDKRVLSKGGISIFTMDYNSSILKDLYRRDGAGLVTIKYNPFDIGYILVLDTVNRVYIKAESDKYSYASGLSNYEHKKIKIEAKKIRASKLENLDLIKSKIKLSKERDKLHARNKRRKVQVTTSKAARSEKIGVSNISLVADRSKQTVKVDLDIEDNDLDMDGWSVD